MKHDLPPALPKILLVEDDPVSQAYLAVVLEALPAVVDAADSAGAALRMARRRGGGHALWLVDAHLPDADGATLLARLRSIAPWTPAIAHTASRERDDIDALLAAGFERVLCKPIGAAPLRKAVRQALHPRAAVAEVQARHPHARWDVAVLRRLFVEELPAQHAAVGVALATGDYAAAAAVMHRMRAACALVGACSLDAAVRALQRDPGSPTAVDGFNRAVASWLRRA